MNSLCMMQRVRFWMLKKVIHPLWNLYVRMLNNRKKIYVIERINSCLSGTNSSAVIRRKNIEITTIEAGLLNICKGIGS